VKNAQELCRGLQELGYKIVTDGTDNHLILVDLRSVGLTGAKGEKILEEIEIACNKNTGMFHNSCGSFLCRFLTLLFV
jgi:glycine hydroxymethyltransferase